jgi:hypothetical protein
MTIFEVKFDMKSGVNRSFQAEEGTSTAGDFVRIDLPTVEYRRWFENANIMYEPIMSVKIRARLFLKLVL